MQPEATGPWTGNIEEAESDLSGQVAQETDSKDRGVRKKAGRKRKVQNLGAKHHHQYLIP